MKRIKFINLPDLETNVTVIAQHLQKVLMDIRKQKLAQELIGNDEKSAEFMVGDMGEFADTLSAGVELTRQDRSRIMQRATRLAERRSAASGLGHLKKDEVARLTPVLKNIQLVMPKGEHWADERAAAIHEDMPWMAKASEYLWHALRYAAERREPIYFRPVILNGPPGIGKSAWARSVAKTLKLPTVEIDASKGGAGFSLVGVERGWSTGQPGRPLELMIASRIANPLIVVDEVCKAQTVNSSSGNNHSFADAMLSLLEPVSAKSWECPFFRLQFDMSHILWLLTANKVSLIPETLRSRCEIIEIPDITTEQLQTFATARGGKLGLSDEAVAAVVEVIGTAPAVIGRRMSLRDVVRMLERAEMLERRPRAQ